MFCGILFNELHHGPSRWLRSMKTSVVFNSTSSNSGNLHCFVEFCSRTGPLTVNVITVCEDVHDFHFNFLKHWKFTLLFGILFTSWTTDRLSDHALWSYPWYSLQLPKMWSLKIQLLQSHFRSLSRSVKWTMNHQDVHDFYFFFSYLPDFHQSIQNTLHSSINSLFLSINCTQISQYINTLNLEPLLSLKW